MENYTVSVGSVSGEPMNITYSTLIGQWTVNGLPLEEWNRRIAERLKTAEDDGPDVEGVPV